MFDGVVLTGGRSSRMGFDKASSLVDGRPLFSYAIAALREAGATRVMAVGGGSDALEAAGVEVIGDLFADQGPLGGILTAFDVGNSPTIVVLPCDVPDVDAAFVESLISALEANPDAGAAVPVVDGKRQAVTAVFRREVGPVVRQVFDSGKRSVQAALDALEVVEIVPEHGVTTDLDTPADIADYLRGASGGDGFESDGSINA